jgi:uncharacterized protein YecE (DUF72 family)
MKPVHIGCSGWNYQTWRGGEFYPKGLPASRWLEHYSRQFDTVEVNSTFYRLARPKAVARWLEQTPPGFVFALKASRYLTHIKRLANLDQGIQRYYGAIEPLVGTPKLGPIVWQLPPNFKRDEERLEGALSALPEGRHCFEFRHESWFTDDVFTRLRDKDVALCLCDEGEGEKAVPWVPTASYGYLRLRREVYSEAELLEVAKKIAAETWTDAYAYFKHEPQAPMQAAQLQALAAQVLANG